MKFLITGATGLLGSRVVQMLAEHEVWAVCREQPRDRMRVRWIEHDLASPALPSGLPDHVDVILHLAQSRNFRRFPQMANEVFGVNTGSTQLLIDWAARGNAGAFVLASSGGVYGHGDDAFREDDPIRGLGHLGHYIATKWAAERLVSAYTDLMNAVILRFFFIYGPGQSDEMLIPRLIDRIRSGQPVQLQGRDGIRLNPVHVDDAAQAVLSAAGKDTSNVVNVAGPEVLTMRDLVSTIGRFVGREPVIELDTGATLRHMVGSTERMAEFLGAPSIGFEEGLERTLGQPAHQE